ncbi:hypothetical protein EHW99_1486 [Erwinia amylovora]|uniref:Uncharacterized protein n=3 Tax=Erwinia amylovora TaxID=552 RepID=A0A831A385_ERWAM|nr:hypothetical protein EaACW_2111 [Erwinia amylovora ACW56400]QJQ54191.1 hypothetical protein EHX00_1486 [Erwinia amylovora]CBA21055.1 hypothetical protein predicted by Glimmer/Critica [Erwinia amylovora CFBP1430]CBX80978.1 hypothetical protein predicted by Glimmer/Critica [Erwinia amylovora ATCC BAA-2158]CCO78958.1 hypothetical protein BN432_2163 [Erwinia amylovora Ea356]CCO82758.1 hypothetical protein BN433_2190 [Erwinia amylovora Ea266]CCO86535.1 hypothetical protein BN434_2150 [Erwinia a
MNVLGKTIRFRDISIGNNVGTFSEMPFLCKLYALLHILSPPAAGKA